MSEENIKKLWKDFGVKEKSDYLKQNAPDCTLVVGPDKRKFPSHKWILSQVSPVFGAMFKGDFKESGLSEIPLPEEEPESFQIFLNFINTGEKQISRETSVEATVRLYKVTQKYILPTIKNECLNNMQSYLSDSRMYGDRDLLRIFEFGHFIEDQNLIERAKHIIYDRLSKCNVNITGCYVNDWDSLIFYQLLLLVKSRLSNIIIFNLIENYAKVNGLSRMTNNGEILKMLECVNFEKITAREFIDGPGDSDLLDLSSRYKYLKKIVNLIANNKCVY